VLKDRVDGNNSVNISDKQAQEIIVAPRQ